MAASTVQNPPAQGESKSARKKKGKAAERTESPAPAATATPDKPASVAGNQDDASDSPYIRELQKSIRNVNKKITNAGRIDHLVAEHGGKSLDELVKQKIINDDQKAAYLKKPSLKAQLSQLEEQLAQLKKIDQDHRAKLAEQEKALTERLEKEKAEIEADLKEKAEADADAKLEGHLLTLTKFLRLAAVRRQVPKGSVDEVALEGILASIYGGDEKAVSVMSKLVKGSPEKVYSNTNVLLDITYAHVKQISLEFVYPEAEPVEPEAEAKEPAQTDPTVANASMTEILEGSDVALTNGHSEEPAPSASIPTTDVADNAANAAGESQFDGSNDTEVSQEWVNVQTPEEPAEIKAPEPQATSAPAASSDKKSWADDQHEQPEPTDGNDDFQQVQRSRPPNRGGNRGGSREGGHRGRGQGRGGSHGGRGGSRGGSGGQRNGQRQGSDRQ